MLADSCCPADYIGAVLDSGKARMSSNRSYAAAAMHLIVMVSEGQRNES